MNMKTKIFRGLKYLAILVVTFISLVLVINLSIFDEELTPEVAEMFEKQQQAIEPDNAYIAIWGITADSNKDFIEAGIELMARHHEITSSSESSILTDLDMEQILGNRDLDRDWKKRYKNCRARTRNGCLKEMSELLNNYPIQDPRLLLMLERYSRMVKLTKYQPIMEIHFASILPSYSEIMRLSQLRVSNVYLKKETMNTLLIIEEEIKFWKLMLKQSGDMLEKMISVASLWRNYRYLSEIIKSETISLQESKKIQSMLMNLSMVEQDMAMVFNTETKMALITLSDIMSTGTNTMSSISGINVKNLSPFWQKNGTLNDAYVRNFIPLVCLSKLTAIDFYKFREQNNDYCEFPKEETTKYINFSLYNPVGKMLVTIGLPAYPDYIARVHDLNGVISLVKLQLELKSIADKDLEEAINNSAIKNHYTGEPMEYNKENSNISFKCLDKSSECKINL